MVRASPRVHDWRPTSVYVLDGSATLVTGGTVVDGEADRAGRDPRRRHRRRREPPDRQGRRDRHPAGVPHLFKDVQGPLHLLRGEGRADGGAGAVSARVRMRRVLDSLRSCVAISAVAPRGAAPTTRMRRRTAGGDRSRHRARASRLVPGPVALQRRADRRDRLPRARPGPAAGRRAESRPTTITPQGRRRRLRRLQLGGDRRRHARGATRQRRRALLQLVSDQGDHPGADRARSIPPASTVVFEIVVDDYAEVWVDGKLPRASARPAARWSKGFNAPNRVVARPRRPAGPADPARRVRHQRARSPNPPANFIWIRSATLDFYRPRPTTGASRVRRGRRGSTPRSTRSCRPAAHDREARRRLPVHWRAIWSWTARRRILLFSDPNANTIYRWAPEGEVSVFRTKSGYAGVDIGEYGQPGSNGLTLDREGRLTINEHGNRRVTRLEQNGVVTVLADRYEGKRLNSPNDLVYKSDGALYFTDPPFGLPKFVRRSAQGAALQRRVPLRGRAAPAPRDRPHRPERPRVLAGRALPLRHELGRAEEGRDALRRRRRRHARPTGACSST